MAEKSETKKPGTPALNTKLAEVAAAVDRVPKRGHNDHFGYDYATESDVLDAVRQALAERHVTLQPAVLEESIRQVNTRNGTTTVTCLRMEMQWRDGESGETLHIPWMGWGVDPADKGGYKAITGAEKYFLMKTFLIPTGDDPETSSDADSQVATTQPRPLANGAVCVTSVKRKQTRNGDTMYIVGFSDGVEASAFEDGIGVMAEKLQGTGEAVARSVTKKGKYTNLISLDAAEIAESDAAAELAAVADQIDDEVPHPAGVELSADEIPF